MSWPSGRGLSASHFLLHGLRVSIFVAILLLIHWQYEKTTLAASDFAPTVAGLRTFFPAAATTEPRSDNTIAVLAEDRTLLGTTLQTSPHSDHIIGFSGPTNVLVAFDAEDRVLGFEILSSGDTREHLRQVESNQAYMNSLNRQRRGELRDPASADVVSGATLTSLAIRESILHRLGGSSDSVRSLRFTEPLKMEDLIEIFPAGATLTEAEDAPARWQVFDPSGEALGSVIRTSPAADNTIGYQGPTDSLLCFGGDGKLAGLVIGKSYDNEPYVGYVRDDAYFRSLFNGKTLSELTAIDTELVEGVSGATMTSMAVTEGMVLAAVSAQKQEREAAKQTAIKAYRPKVHDVGTAIVIVLAIAIGMTSLRSNARLRVIFQLVLVVYLGLLAGNLVSQAMLVGWARHGVPWKAALGLALLSVAAFAIPIATRRNLYCTHLCPHGALQQLVRNRIRMKFRLPTQVKFFLAMIPAMLLAWCVIVAMTSIGFSLVDIEAFDAYLFRIAGWATLTIAIGGLIASLFVPMAYCRYGCPTGALLQFLRFNAASSRWSVRDWVAASYLCLAILLFVFS